MCAGYLGVFVLLGAICGVLSQCEVAHVERCVGNLKGIYENNDGPVIVKSENELITMCRHYQTALGCVNDFVNRCFEEQNRNVFNNLTSGVQEFVFDFCSPQSTTRKIYLKHLSCFNKVVDELHHCTQRLQEWNRDTEKQRQKQPKYETIRQTCCRYELAMSCMRTVVRNGCPDEAADLFDQMTTKISKHFFQVADCSSHTYVVSDCSAASSLVSIPMSVLALGALAVALLSTFTKFW